MSKNEKNLIGSKWQCIGDSRITGIWDVLGVMPDGDRTKIFIGKKTKVESDNIVHGGLAYTAILLDSKDFFNQFRLCSYVPSKSIVAEEKKPVNPFCDEYKCNCGHSPRSERSFCGTNKKFDRKANSIMTNREIEEEIERERNGWTDEEIRKETNKKFDERRNSTKRDNQITDDELNNIARDLYKRLFGGVTFMPFGVWGI